MKYSHNDIRKLYKAIRSNKRIIVASLLDKGIDVIIRDSQYNRSPLHYAISNGNYKIAKQLVRYNSNLVNVTDEYGRTPLFNAVLYNNVDMINYLIKHGADIRKQDNFGKTAFEYEQFITS